MWRNLECVAVTLRSRGKSHYALKDIRPNILLYLYI